MATEYKKISQLPAAESLRGTDQLEIEREGTSKSITASLIKDYTNDGLIDDAHSGSQSTYSSGLIDQKLDLKQNATDNRLNTVSKTIVGAINELLVYVLNIASEYDDEATYDVGDYCIHAGILYKCIVAITVAEAWTAAHWTSTLIVDNFGTGGGGASVTLGTTTPSDASGSNGDLYVQYEALTYKVVEYFVKINNSWRKSPYSRVVALTQAEYDLITPDPTTLYIITDAQSSYQTKVDANLQTTATTIVGAINELNTDKQDKIPDTVAKTVTFDASGYTGEVKAKVYNRVCYISGYFRFSANQSANTQILHVSDVTLAMEFFESAFTDGSTTVRFKITTDGKLLNENQLPANQWVSISLACLIA